MFHVKCIRKYRDKYDRVYAYIIEDRQSNTKFVTASDLKRAIMCNKVCVDNLKLTSDYRLVDKREDEEVNEKDNIAVQSVEIDRDFLNILGDGNLLEFKIVSNIEDVCSKAKILGKQLTKLCDRTYKLNNGDNVTVVTDRAFTINYIEKHGETSLFSISKFKELVFFKEIDLSNVLIAEYSIDKIFFRSSFKRINLGNNCPNLKNTHDLIFSGCNMLEEVITCNECIKKQFEMLKLKTNITDTFEDLFKSSTKLFTIRTYNNSYSNCSSSSIVSRLDNKAKSNKFEIEVELDINNVIDIRAYMNGIEISYYDRTTYSKKELDDFMTETFDIIDKIKGQKVGIDKSLEYLMNHRLYIIKIAKHEYDKNNGDIKKAEQAANKIYSELIRLPSEKINFRLCEFDNKVKFASNYSKFLLELLDKGIDFDKISFDIKI